MSFSMLSIASLMDMIRLLYFQVSDAGWEKANGKIELSCGRRDWGMSFGNPKSRAFSPSREARQSSDPVILQNDIASGDCSRVSFGRETRWTRGPPPAMSLSIPSEIAQRVHGFVPDLGPAVEQRSTEKNLEKNTTSLLGPSYSDYSPENRLATREPVTLHRKVEEFVLYSSAREFLALVLRFVHSIGPI